MAGDRRALRPGAGRADRRANRVDRPSRREPTKRCAAKCGRSLPAITRLPAGSFRSESTSPSSRSSRTSTAASTPARVGPYRLVRELGRGGMGAVFLAERDDDEYRAKVAVKLVRPGMDTEFILSRFRRERQTLARLQHPNISRLLDGGTTDHGLPYIVMEYIDGPWITTYATQHKLGVEARVSLFLAVCSAVDYAHRNFIVHRDLKPSNILVDARRRAQAARLRHLQVARRDCHCERYGCSAADPELCQPRADPRRGRHHLLGHLLARRSALRTLDGHQPTPLREPDAARDATSSRKSDCATKRGGRRARASRASSPATWTTSSCELSTSSPRADTSRPRNLQTICADTWTTSRSGPGRRRSAIAPAPSCAAIEAQQRPSRRSLRP